MTRYIAFLRAINVGGHTVKMDHLRQLFEALGFTNVETFIASGNVILEAKSKNNAAFEKQIGAHLKSALGYEVDTFVRTRAEVADLEKRNPFPPGKTGQDVYIAFLHETPHAAAQSALLALRNNFNDFAIIDREVYWSRLNKDDSIFLKNSLEKILHMSATTRSLTTIQKLTQKYPP
jgi:uncharacterized protein (DUF1697 family)